MPSTVENKMKIIVTGANGYLGQGVVKQLLSRGHDVTAVDFSVQNVDIGARAIACNLFEIENPTAYWGQHDVLLHMAWRDGFMHYAPSHIADLPNHFSFLEKMVKGGIKKIAVMGTMHEVGFYEGSIREETPCHPSTPYGISKNALRSLLHMLAVQNGIAYQWLRGFYVVGNTRLGNSVFSKLVAADYEGKEMFPFTMGQNQYDFISYEDFCNQVAAAVSQDAVNGVINICSGYPEKLADRVERFIRENGMHIRLKYGAYPDRPYDSKAVWGDETKIQQILSAEQQRK